jgi:hypothetical protein
MGKFFCPICGAPESSRERRPNGNSWCQAGQHTYPSANALSHPTPVQGEPLPVVAFMHRQSGCLFPTHKEAGFLVEHYAPLTDHAQATAEIANRDAVIEKLDSHAVDLMQTIHEQDVELTTLRTQLAGALAESGEMRGLVGRFLEWCEKPAGFDKAMVMDNKQFGEFLKGIDSNRDALLSEARAALNSTAQESAE